MLPTAGVVVTAGMDLGFRSDSSALVIVHTKAQVRTVAEIVELRPVKGIPLKPSETIKKFAERLKAHGASHVLSDRHYQDTVIEYLIEYDLVFVPAPNTPVDAYMRTRALMRQGLVKIPNHQRMLQQFSEIQGRPLAGGGMSVVSPRWKSGGHGDILSALVLALYATGGDEIAAPKNTSIEAWEEAQRAGRRKACAEAQQETPWYRSTVRRPTGRR